MKRWLLTALLLLVWSSVALAQDVLRVGAKHFNEGYILGEMVALILEDGGFTVERRFNLGGTAVSFEALKNGAIDVYPEYTGTLAAEILGAQELKRVDAIDSALQQRWGLRISASYGFNNTYALLMRPQQADSLSMRDIMDLQKHADLQLGLSYEFLKRRDGWEPLASAYGLPQQPVGLEHGLAYQALRDGRIDVTDAYSTDGEIGRYGLRLLTDNKHFFPTYEAVSFYRAGLPAKAVEQLRKLTGKITAAEMQALNAQALFEEKPFRTIAYDFLRAKQLIGTTTDAPASKGADIMGHVWDHLLLTGLALLAAVMVALPLGVVLYRFSYVAKTVLYLTGILQTIPSIALLALMIPLFGIGLVPAVIALFLYALLPILRNTVVGLVTVDPALKKVAAGIGLTPWNRLRLVELPLAMPSILTGIRTAAVINVGTATLAAFIGAGGLGEFIVTGLALNNTSLILQGAVPAAVLAVGIELLFELLEWWLVPAHLRRRYQ
ncbi:ABC transporter permease subunit [Fulvivirgaceae bacterium PWU5]|uniref:ABC transporter permease subunit n=1 Tax=Dawidia cretensis TaxID=2782350 RepID=A0AAP2DVW6_9BACT|nr:glycine betaine ABC transporter substrate-binding protein [Dawidia cretensis]MBT1708575.1 ABC transporter permease subunit [Dawidia cretensis]